jgi:DNA-binding GntR family transcriptional regulator
MEKIGGIQVKDRIAELLRQEIISGRMADGEELTQEQLASSLGVSRMPVREAIQILELEGLLVRLPNRHVRVIGFNERSARETMRAIAAFEAEYMRILEESGTSELDNHYLNQTRKRLMDARHMMETVLKGMIKEETREQS